MSPSCKYCLRPLYANELCTLHYQRQKRGAKLEQEVQWVEFDGSSKKRGPHPVEMGLENRSMLRAFYSEFVRKYYL